MSYKPYKTVVKIWDGNMNGGLCRYLDALRDLGCKVSFFVSGEGYRDGIVLKFSICINDDASDHSLNWTIVQGTRVVFLHGKSGKLLGVEAMTQEEAEDFLVEDKPARECHKSKDEFVCVTGERVRIMRDFYGNIIGIRYDKEDNAFDKRRLTKESHDRL